MKKKWIIIAVVLVAAIVAWQLIVRLKRREIVIARLVPEPAGLFIEVKGVEEAWSRITRTGFWQELLASVLWKESGIEEKIEAFRRDFEEDNGFPLDRKNLMELLGQDFGLALVSPGEDETSVSLLVISRVGLRARLIEFLARWGNRWKETDQQSLIEEEYAGQKIVIIKPTPSFPFFAAYTFINNYFVGALSLTPASPTIQQVVDLSQNRGEILSLAEHPDYRKAHRASSLASDCCAECYLRLDWLSRRVGKGIFPVTVTGSPPASLDWEEIKQIVREELPILKTVSGQIRFDRGVRARLLLEMDKNKRRAFWGCQPRPRGEETRMLAFRNLIPSQSLGYLWFQTDFLLLWERIKNIRASLNPQSYQNFLSTLRNWEKDTGLMIGQDILPWLGREVALVGGGIDTAGLSMLELACVFRVESREKADKVMERLAAWLITTYHLSPTREKYAGIEITLFPLPLMLQPGYALADDFLIISSSRELLRKMIDVKQGEGAAITTDSDFQMVTAEMAQAANSFLYLNSEKLLEEVREVGNWLIALQKLRHEEEWIAEDLYRQKIAPFLQLCRVFKAIAVSTRCEDEVVIQDFYWYIEDKPKESTQQ